MPQSGAKRLYMISIGCCQKIKHVEKKELDEVLKWLKLNIPKLEVIENSYEFGSHYSQLHCHALVRVPSKTSYRHLTRYGDKRVTGSTFHMRWDRVKNMAQISYILKEAHPAKQEQTLDENNYRLVYRFIN